MTGPITGDPAECEESMMLDLGYLRVIAHVNVAHPDHGGGGISKPVTVETKHSISLDEAKARVKEWREAQGDRGMGGNSSCSMMGEWRITI